MDATTAPDLAGPCPLASRHGGLEVVDDGEYGWIDGTVEDGVLPVSVLEVVATEGDCRLYKKTNPFCDPPCDPGEACGAYLSLDLPATLTVNANLTDLDFGTAFQVSIPTTTGLGATVNPRVPLGIGTSKD